MNIFSLLLAVTFGILTFSQIFLLYKKTTCRQAKWLREVENETAKLLDKAPFPSINNSNCHDTHLLTLQLQGKM
jgi:hypothetical protein